MPPFQFERLNMSANVMDWCRQKGISFADLVNRTGLEENRVQAIMLGRWTPSPIERQKVAAAIGEPIDEIVWGHATPIQHLYGHGPG
jgi:cyanate lyase